MSPDPIDQLASMVGANLANESLPTQQRIRELIGQVRTLPMFATVDDEAAETLAREFEERHGVTMTIGAVVTEDDYEPWLDQARAEIDPYYWIRYKQLLTEKQFSGQVMASLDEVTDRILGLLENPSKEGNWDRRGMVVGHVQSGKTANYLGLINKAADAGYKLIVVIAGVNNNLRNQTQARVDEGFVGRDSARILSKRGERFIGVGKFDQRRRPATFTNTTRDFNKQMATGIGVSLQNLKEPAVLVIKKHSTTLQNLLEWLKEHSASSGSQTVDAPMLLIDDEADNASIDIKRGRDEVSRINGLIRDLLQLFNRSCYLGYTATPFANIFIDPDSDDEMRGVDLYPRHFIYGLDPPSNYFGPLDVFTEDSDVVRLIEDNDNYLPLKHDINLRINDLPPSLVRAVRGFVLTRAIRLIRGHKTQHMSMMVNASRFTNIQTQLRNEIHQVLRRIQSSARINGSLPEAQALRDPELAALHDVWVDEYVDNEGSWVDIQAQLNEAAAPITVVEINSRSSGALNYADHATDGLNVIAVGGFSLSRGLTLEGLTVSYFLRNSVMYDTLMQMGRWFGYRPGYEDLCRVWMPEEAAGWYEHISTAIEDLSIELRVMEAAGATPMEFGLKIRSHPAALMVTARNKMGSGQRVVVNVGLGNKFVETHLLRRDTASLDSNYVAATTLAADMEAAGFPTSGAEKISGGWLVRDVPVGPIKRFVSGFRNHEGALLTDSTPVVRYIIDRETGALSTWDVMFPSIARNSKDTLSDDTLGIAINCQTRAEGSRIDSRTLKISNRQRVASRGIEKTGLTPEQVNEAESAYRAYAAENDPKRAGVRANYPDWSYRKERTKPLLLVHMLKIENVQGQSEINQPVVAWGISFPYPGHEEQTTEYVVNTTWLRENYREDLEEDEMGGDYE